MKNNLFLTTAPHTVNWNFTYKCNLNCTHCYSRNRIDIEEMNKENKIKTALNLIKSNVFLVNLGGGEPICSPDVYDIIKIFSDNGTYISLSTNGHFINIDVANKLKEVNLTAACISLDHIDPKIHNEGRGYKNSFEEAVKAINLFTERNIKVVISTVITSKNVYSLEELIKFLIKLKCATISLRRLKVQGNAVSHSELLLNEKEEKYLYKKIQDLKNKYSNNIVVDFVYGATPIPEIDKGCSCGKTSIGIMPNGNIIPCVYNEKLSIGNILEDDLEILWENSKKLNYLRENFKCIGLLLELITYTLNPKVKVQYSLFIKNKTYLTEEISNPDDIFSIAYYNKKEYKFNFIATLVLKELEKTIGIQEIVNKIIKFYPNIDTKKLTTDINTFIKSLEEKGLLIIQND